MYPDSIYIKPALSYIIGSFPGETAVILKNSSVDSLEQFQIEELIEFGNKKKLKLHRFKKTMVLPRVSKVLGYLKGIYPQTILDIGTGRGVFLWPLLDAFPNLEVTCADILPYHIQFLEAVKAGGMNNIQPVLQDIGKLDFGHKSFDVVTFLETLEHVPNPEKALRNAFRMAKKALILSVPSKEDDNPEHIHLLKEDFFTGYFVNRTDCKVSFDYVLNHLIVLVFKKYTKKDLLHTPFYVYGIL